MICPSCKSFVEDYNRFCTECGASFNTPAGSAPFTGAAASGRTNPTPPRPPSESLIGVTLDGKYRIDGLIGAGGMGSVYRATRLMIGDQVALKLMRSELLADQHAVERFRREAQAAARLKHPNAVAIYDFGVSAQGFIYIVMELVDGQSLRQVIRQQGVLTAAAAAEILRQSCAALDEAHRQNIVHRDIKPDNMIVHATNTGLTVKVLDFGIAKLRDLSPTATNLTQTGGVVGTPHYMSPEQCVGEEIDHRSDIYSLGVVLYESLTGTLPFNSPNPGAIVVQHVTQPPPPPRAINLSITPSVEAVILHAMQKRREERPQTAGMLAQEFINAVQGVPLVANPTTGAMPQPQIPTGAGAAYAPTVQMQYPQMSGGTPATPFPLAPAIGQWHSGLQAAAPKKSKAIPVLLAVAVVLLIAIGVVVFLTMTSVKSSILNEAKKGNLVKPEGSSAYDLYFKNKSDLKDADKTEIANQVTSDLERRGNEIMAQLKNDANESEAEWNEAIKIYTWLHDLKASSSYEARRYFSQASLAFSRKDYTKALSDYRSAVEKDGNWALAANRLGRTYVNLKDKESARQHYIRATQLEPNWIYPWINLGGLYVDLNEPYNAQEALQRALQIDPNKASVHWMMGQTYEKMERWCDAVNEYTTAVNNAYNSGKDPGFTVDRVKARIEQLTSRYSCY